MYNSAGESQCCHQDSAPRPLLLALLAAAILCATATVETVSHTVDCLCGGWLFSGAEASQWDGTDMLMNWGWGLPHSKRTYSAGYGPYWTMSAESAYVQSKSLWKQVRD